MFFIEPDIIRKKLVFRKDMVMDIIHQIVVDTLGCTMCVIKAISTHTTNYCNLYILDNRYYYVFFFLRLKKHSVDSDRVCGVF